MSSEDPRRLRELADDAPELVRALKALRREDVGSERLERVAAKLGPLLDAPPPANTLWTQLARHRLSLLKIGLAGLVVCLVPWLWPARHEVAPAQLRPAVIDANALKASDHASASAAEPNNTAPVVVPSELTPVLDDHSVTTVNKAPPRQRRRSTRAAARSGQLMAATAEPVGAAAPSSPVAAEVVSPLPMRVPEPEKPPVVHERVPTEAQLLFEARKTMQSDRTAAMALLNRHASLYPHGLLVPEREVLLIEALRHDGRTAEAAERLKRFEHDYPDSLHLRRLKAK